MKKLAWIAPLALAACGQPAPETETAATETATTPAATNDVATTDAPPAAFGQCAVCHKIDKDGGNGIGPNLHGVAGRKAASIAGFMYSDAMKSSNLTWDDATLDKYLAKPAEVVPGTKMSFAGISDAAKRKDVIDWLKKQS